MCAAERALRDVLVLRCLRNAEARDRKGFLEALKTAFGVDQLDTDLQAQLLLSHRKICDASDTIDTFPSNGMLATMWRGAPRPRRKRARGGKAATAEALCNSDADAEVEALGGNGTGPQSPIGPVGGSASDDVWSRLLEPST